MPKRSKQRDFHSVSEPETNIQFRYQIVQTQNVQEFEVKQFTALIGSTSEYYGNQSITNVIIKLIVY